MEKSLYCSRKLHESSKHWEEKDKTQVLERLVDPVKKTVDYEEVGGYFCYKYKQPAQLRVFGKIITLKISNNTTRIRYVSEVVQKKDRNWHETYDRFRKKSMQLQDEKDVIKSIENQREDYDSRMVLRKVSIMDRYSDWHTTTNDYWECMVFESKVWVKNTRKLEVSVQDLKNMQNTIVALAEDVAKSKLTNRHEVLVKEDNVLDLGIKYTVKYYSSLNFRHNRALVLLDFRIGQVQYEAQSFSWAIADINSEQNYQEFILNVERAYEHLELYDEWAKSIEKNTEKVNLALSPEEDEILSKLIYSKQPRELQFPALISGSAGSGKSTMLYYLAAEKLYEKLFKENKMEGDLCFITFTEELLKIAKNSVKRLLTDKVRHLGGCGEDGMKRVRKINDYIEEHFYTFYRFVTKTLNPDNEIVGFNKFKNIFWPNKRSNLNRNIDSEVVWHVINAYIVGEIIVNNKVCELVPEEYRKLTIKSVSDESYQDIYDKIWKEYKNWKRENNEIDISDLINEALDKQGLLTYSMYFCDEVQDFNGVAVEFMKIRSKYVFDIEQYGGKSQDGLLFCLAGDQSQTVSPTGFTWSGVKNKFQLEDPNHWKNNEHTLRFNYRSESNIVRFANSLQWLRKKLAIGNAENDMAKRVSWAIEYQVPTKIENDSTELHACDNILFYRAPDEGIIPLETQTHYILPCFGESKETEEYVGNDINLKGMKDDMIRFIYSPLQAKGQEWEDVVIYKFGQHFVDLQSNKDGIKEMYFLNSLYVAITRAKTNIIIIDTQKGIDNFWKYVSSVFESAKPEKTSEWFKNCFESLEVIETTNASDLAELLGAPLPLAEFFLEVQNALVQEDVIVLRRCLRQMKEYKDYQNDEYYADMVQANILNIEARARRYESNLCSRAADAFAVIADKGTSYREIAIKYRLLSSLEDATITTLKPLLKNAEIGQYAVNIKIWTNLRSGLAVTQELSRIDLKYYPDSSGNDFEHHFELRYIELMKETVQLVLASNNESDKTIIYNKLYTMRGERISSILLEDEHIHNTLLRIAIEKAQFAQGKDIGDAVVEKTGKCDDELYYYCIAMSEHEDIWPIVASFDKVKTPELRLKIQLQTNSLMSSYGINDFDELGTSKQEKILNYLVYSKEYQKAIEGIVKINDPISIENHIKKHFMENQKQEEIIRYVETVISKRDIARICGTVKKLIGYIPRREVPQVFNRLADVVKDVETLVDFYLDATKKTEFHSTHLSLHIGNEIINSLQNGNFRKLNHEKLFNFMIKTELDEGRRLFGVWKCQVILENLLSVLYKKENILDKFDYVERYISWNADVRDRLPPTALKAKIKRMYIEYGKMSKLIGQKTKITDDDIRAFIAQMELLHPEDQNKSKTDIPMSEVLEASQNAKVKIEATGLIDSLKSVKKEREQKFVEIGGFIKMLEESFDKDVNWPMQVGEIPTKSEFMFVKAGERKIVITKNDKWLEHESLGVNVVYNPKKKSIKVTDQSNEEFFILDVSNFKDLKGNKDKVNWRSDGKKLILNDQNESVEISNIDKLFLENIDIIGFKDAK